MTLEVSYKNGERIFTEIQKRFQIIESRQGIYLPHLNVDGVYLYSQKEFKTLADSVEYCRQQLLKEGGEEIE